MEEEGGSLGDPAEEVGAGSEVLEEAFEEEASDETLHEAYLFGLVLYVHTMAIPFLYLDKEDSCTLDSGSS